MTRLLSIATALGIFLALGNAAEAKGPKGGAGKSAGSSAGKGTGKSGSGIGTGKGTGTGTGKGTGAGTGKGTGAGKANHAYPRGFNNWSYRFFDSRYGCELCYSDVDGCYFYFYPPADCYYPLSYFEHYPPAESSSQPPVP
jgi:hypothetical protein